MLGEGNGVKYELVLLRHGKSAYPSGVEDFDRPLAARGRRQARRAGEWVNKEVGAFDLIVCSPAKRTRSTLEEAALHGPVEYVDALYQEAHVAYLQIISKYGGNVHRMALIGHHPAISATALALTRNRDSEAARRLEHKYPTSAVARLVGTADFSHLETEHFKLEQFYVPAK